jgi:hypothetical protein
MDIELLPKGALPDTPDSRDFEAPLGAVQVDWTQEFRLPEPPDEDQDSSDCCVAEAWSYYHWQLKGKKFSRRDLFCRIALPYGAYIRDGGLAIVKEGQATREEVKDPEPQTPANMRDSRGTKPEFRTDDKMINSFVLPQQDINGVAWGIKEYKGVVFGVNGNNDGWKDMKYPKPPVAGEPIWGHALYAMGYHTCIDGQKCIIAKSSWCKTVKEHHIRENYFFTGNTFNAWTLIPKETLPVNQTKVVLSSKDNNTVWLCTPVSKMEVLQDRASVEGFVIPVTILNGDKENAPKTADL